MFFNSILQITNYEIMKDTKFSVTIEKYDYNLLQLPASSGLEIDLGCGDGSFSAELSALNPDKTIIAVDTLGGRLEKCRKKALKSNLQNMIIIKAEALFFLQIMLPDDSADAIHLLCPDPWPKDKHRYHRIISSEFTGIIARKLKEKGIFHFSTDHSPYFEATKRIFSLNTQFKQIPIPEKLIPLKTDFEIQWNSEGKEVRHICWQKI